jgi:alpha-beta hydrolase superfamily lysophospholipase
MANAAGWADGGFPTSSRSGWTVAAEDRGVRVLSRGEGRPVIVFSGLEGSGESCLHLVLPTIEVPPAGAPPQRPLLVDYAAEAHDRFEDLVATASRLVTGVVGTQPCAMWCQSFGNLLGTSVVLSGGLDVEKLVLVSPFTRLPRWKLTPLVLGALRLTPGALYRVFSGLIGRWQFGPAGGNRAHPFFASLKALAPPVLKRRAAWLSGRNFADNFRQLRAPHRAFLGSRDNLVDRKEQQLFFESLAPSIGLEMFEGSGHVVLPPAVIAEARTQLRGWFWSEHV